MCSCDGDPPSCFLEQTRRARKEHTCCECFDRIRPGDTYRHCSGVWDGRPDSFAQCANCAAWWDALMRAPNGCVCITFGGLWERVQEWADEQDDVIHQAERMARLARLMPIRGADGFAMPVDESRIW